MICTKLYKIPDYVFLQLTLRGGAGVTVIKLEVTHEPYMTSTVIDMLNMF